MSEYTLVLSSEHLLVIDRALGLMPYRDAAPVVAAINEQLLAAQNAEQDGPPLDGRN